MVTLLRFNSMDRIGKENEISLWFLWYHKNTAVFSKDQRGLYGASDLRQRRKFNLLGCGSEVKRLAKFKLREGENYRKMRWLVGNFFTITTLAGVFGSNVIPHPISIHHKSAILANGHNMWRRPLIANVKWGPLQIAPIMLLAPGPMTHRIIECRSL